MFWVLGLSLLSLFFGLFRVVWVFGSFWGLRVFWVLGFWVRLFLLWVQGFRVLRFGFLCEW